MNITSFLAKASAGYVFSIILTVIAIMLFITAIIVIWWVDVKKRSYKSFWNGVKNKTYNAFDSVHDFFTSNKPVKTVYSDKTLNYSGTEFLPVPTKAPNDKYTYEFVGWDKNGIDENGNFVVKAIYLQRVIKCYINVFNDDRQTLLTTKTIEYGAGVNLDELRPTKDETKEFTYEFVGWDKDLTAFYGNTNVYAVYKAVPKKYTYIFYEDNKKVIVSQGVAIYGTPIIAPNPPMKTSTGKEIYEFVGWKNYVEGMLLTKNCAFYAMYKKKNVADNDSTPILNVDGTVQRNRTDEIKRVSENKTDNPIKSVIEEKTTSNSSDNKINVVKLNEENNDLAMNQKIQLVAKRNIVDLDKEEVKEEVKVEKVKSENNEDELNIFPNIVVNKRKINKK